MNPPTQQRATAQDNDTLTPAVSEHGGTAHPVSATVVLLPLEPEPTSRLRWGTRLLVDEGTRRNARIQVRTRLTVANWTGDVDAAARVAAELAANAAQHGRPFEDERVALRLHLRSESGVLLIEMDDANPDFPDFAVAASGRRGAESGLGFARRQGAQLSWDVSTDPDGAVLGKTVRAVVAAGCEEESA
ncbi:hypothetical protein ACF07Y_39165 [Streptomyces sp. NPDC016566]|uniref:hypothetical protein n=1 Tax=Streptomyces sp. NPDC016566 TaxID=3364967 RepID=UPI0036F965B3